MVKCVKCGAQLKAEDCFCDICGAKQKKEKKCECGFILEEFFAFCPMCGKSLAKETSADIKKMNSIKLEQKILGMKEAFDFVDSYQESDLSTLLLSAVDDGEVPIAAALLEAGADIDVCDDDDYSSTPLMKACESGNNDMVKLLLSYEPDLYAENDDGETARDLAKSAGKNYIVRLLNEAESSDSKKTKKSDKLENFSTSIASLTSLWRKK